MPASTPVDLQKFLKSQPMPAKLWQGQDKDRYFEALHLYWGGNKNDALRVASDTLADDDQCPLRFAFYRLWIQVASDLGETLSLNGLRDHLLLVGQTDAAHRDTLMALRGIIHLELDQVDAARLLSRGLEGFNDDPYVLEFLDGLDAQIHADRRTSDSPSRLFDVHSEVRDWFHWQSITRALLRRGANDKAWINIRTVAQHVTQLFPASPMEAECDMHRSFESGRFADAFIYASKLAKLYPAKTDYLFYRAFARFKCGEPRAALDIIKAEQASVTERDADLVLLRGACLADLAIRSGGEAHLNDASETLRSAIRLARNEGMPTRMATKLLADVSEHAKADSDEPEHSQVFRPARIWFAKVTPEQYFDLRSAPESQIEKLMRPMGNQPQPGDLCFFAGEGPAYNPNGSPGWRIAAVYSVSTPPAWHPVHRYETALTLISRPEFAIPVDMQILDSEVSINPDVPRSHPIRSGVFEVEMGALDVIMEIICSRSEGSAVLITWHMDMMSGMRWSV